MATASTYELLPATLQGRVDSLIRDHRFGNYTELVDQVNALIEAEGMELAFSRSALGRHGKSLKDTIERVKAAHQAAKEIAEAFPEDQERVSESVIRALQTRLLELSLKDDIDQNVLLKLARATADLARADIASRQYRDQLKEKLAAKFEELEQINHPLSETIDMRTLQRIRSEIYGLL